MNIENLYRENLKRLRMNPQLLSEYSIESATDNNRNQINRNRILIALYNDCKSSDYEIASFIFNEEKKLRTSTLTVEEYEIEVLYLSAFILTKFERVEDIWSFIESKTIDFDSSIGFDTEYLLSFGIEKVYNYLKNSNHPNKEVALQIVGGNISTSPYTQEEIENWKKGKYHYFLVFEFPIKDKIDFCFQAKEYEYLRKLLPEWKANKNDWTENQNLTSIAIGRVLKIDNFLLEALTHYVNTNKKSVRNEMYKKEITELKQKLNVLKKGNDTKKNWWNFLRNEKL